MALNCPTCGTQNDDTAQFCRQCGSKFGAGSFPPPPAGGSPGPPAPPTYGSYPPYPDAAGGSTPSYGSYPPYAQNSYGQPPAPAPYQPGGFPAPVPPYPAAGFGQQGGQMSKIGMILSIVSGCLMAVGLIPCLGWVNYFTLLFAVVSAVLSLVSFSSEAQTDIKARNQATIALVVAGISAIVGVFRLFLGGCVF